MEKNFLRSFSRKPWYIRFGLPLLAVCLLLGIVQFTYEHRHIMSSQLRYSQLPLFNPHRTEFTCIQQAAVVPPIDPEADLWFEKGMAVTSEDKYEEDKDYKTAAALWTKAAQRKHWKAQNNLAGLYLRGKGVPLDVEKALQLTEEAMAWGVPQAWDNMGSYHMQGVGGLKPDATVAYAFWQKAADMGAPGAQTLLGGQLLASYDSPKNGFWANKKIGLQMLECALSQGQGAAARKLGLEYERQKTSEGKLRALAYYQDGVKFGDQDSADALEIAFESGPLNYAAPFVDHDRERRYQVFGKALRDNPDLRFPNLDKVLPLPPAKLPYWDGEENHLLEAAGEVHPVSPEPAPGIAK
ncbi:sel1 repeat family protein [Collimonas pratensis]|uniref:Sel1 repeat family protein n=1 Tax=Collimonas pratensis TaxID=279113 RepID=A0A127PYG8_9BURK|nr:DUF6396 domain-containing protein [Collimonas pratensis]AMP02422.1 sel1 repeat family protein [Collimonas pratensis]NKI70855.1 sel1 repeat family protein [Collimonas pratensis]